jgi:geranylgeranyl diphosphate synthase type I
VTLSNPLETSPQLKTMLAAVESACRESLNHKILLSEPAIFQMLSYHMGWDPALPGKKGKRIRPLLVCLVAQACGTDWQRTLPAAASVELLHNFTLIHDDIQDQSDERHGLPALWKIHGIAQAINAGDAMYSLALDHLWRLRSAFSVEIIAQCSEQLTLTCLHLTAGQYQDMEFETRPVIRDVAIAGTSGQKFPVTADEYIRMVEGKTTAMLRACCNIGTILAGATEEMQATFDAFGYHLGIAFQVMDDYLGVWGDSAQTGKSNATDLINHKRSIPVIWGLERSSAFQQRWVNGDIQASDIYLLRDMLTDAGVASDVLMLAKDHTLKAFACLQKAITLGAHTSYLPDLTEWLLNRNK